MIEPKVSDGPHRTPVSLRSTAAVVHRAGPIPPVRRRGAGHSRRLAVPAQLLGQMDGRPDGGAVSSDTEYWCPMCPGVVSDWPTKCPVCSMTLVRRQKGEMTPLPDGVVARVQLSPYRIQLAGVRTSAVEFRRLECEVVVPGLLESLPRGIRGTSLHLGQTCSSGTPA